MNILKTINTTNCNLIEEAKEIFRLADPAFDFRKDDRWDITNKERLERGVGCEVIVDIGRSDGEDGFISWLTSHVINPIIKVKDTHILIKTRTETIVGLSWKNLVSINTVSEDNQSKSYKVIFSAGGFDYSVRLVINNTMQPYLLYV